MSRVSPTCHFSLKFLFFLFYFFIVNLLQISSKKEEIVSAQRRTWNTSGPLPAEETQSHPPTGDGRDTAGTPREHGGDAGAARTPAVLGLSPLPYIAPVFTVPHQGGSQRSVTTESIIHLRL